jgi:hypothetical protein
MNGLLFVIFIGGKKRVLGNFFFFCRFSVRLKPGNEWEMRRVLFLSTLSFVQHFLQNGHIRFMDGIVSTESVALHEQIRTEEEVERREQERVEQHAKYSIEHANKAGVDHPHKVVPAAAGRGHFFRISLKYVILRVLLCVLLTISQKLAWSSHFATSRCDSHF